VVAVADEITSQQNEAQAVAVQAGIAHLYPGRILVAESEQRLRFLLL
jgi:hypothetical protein